MARIPLGVGAYSRPFGKLPEIKLENRFFEKNPLGAEQVALLSRPGTKLFLEVGNGPIRAFYAQAGVFDHDLFIVSGQELYRYDGTNAPTLITGTVSGSGYPVMTSVSVPGWQAVFITDGASLQYYEGEGRATGTLTIDTPGIAADDTVEIGGVYYVWKAADLDTGSPAGTLANPWKVLLGGDDETCLSNLFSAILGTGIPGSTYSSALTAHSEVSARSLTDASFEVYAKTAGTAGNSITTTETSAALSWSGGTLAGGGGHELKSCEVPDGQAVSDLATLAGFVICAIGGSQKFYWIRPGEVTIDALDFSSAESEPDEIVNVAVVGDQLWIFGQSSTEPWYVTGDLDQPFQRSQGRVFSQGIIPGTFAKFGEEIVVVGQDMIAYRIAGGPERISHHGIEELFRRWQELVG